MTEPSPAFDPSSFVALISGLGAQAKILLGLMANPVTGQMEPKDLSRAKVLIDTLQMLQTKTEGNLGPEEKRFLDTILTDVQLRYVENQ